MKRPFALAVMTALLLSGVAAGALATHLFYAQKMSRPSEGPLWFMGPPPLRHLDHRLQLSSDQRSRIGEILRQSRRQGERIREQTRPQISELLRETHERILEVLTPEQRKTFEELPQRRHRHRGREGRGRRGRRAPPPEEESP